MKKMWTGTSVKITAIFDLPVDSANITVEDPNSTVKINEAAMTKDQNTVYSYVYQSAIADQAGEYEVTIKAIKAQYTALSQSYFTLYDSVND